MTEPTAPREPAIYLLRHGETEWSRDGRHTSHTDIPLTPRGEEQAKEAGHVLATLLGGRQPATVLCSPRQRALRTAELAGLDPATTRVEAALTEWDYGDHEGLRTDEIRRTLPDWTIWTGPWPNGENPGNVIDRASDFLDDVVRPLLGQGDVVLVGHGHFSRVLIACWLDLASTQGVRFRMDTGSVSVLGHERGVPQLVHSNVTRLP